MPDNIRLALDNTQTNALRAAFALAERPFKTRLPKSGLGQSFWAKSPPDGGSPLQATSQPGSGSDILLSGLRMTDRPASCKKTEPLHECCSLRSGACGSSLPLWTEPARVTPRDTGFWCWPAAGPKAMRRPPCSGGPRTLSVLKATPDLDLQDGSLPMSK